METHDCDHYQARLAALVLDGGAELVALVADGRRCAACAAMLDDLGRALGRASTPDVPAMVARHAVERGARWARTIYAIGKSINIAISVTFVGLWLAYVELDDAIGWPAAAGSARAAMVVASVCVVGYLALRGRAREDGRAVLYARWHGRQLQGICVGIAAYVGVPTWVVRTAFVALFLAGLGGVTIYFLLAFIVSFHPDDREHLGWFKVQRWWRRRRGLAA